MSKEVEGYFMKLGLLIPLKVKKNSWFPSLMARWLPCNGTPLGGFGRMPPPPQTFLTTSATLAIISLWRKPFALALQSRMAWPCPWLWLSLIELFESQVMWSRSWLYLVHLAPSHCSQQVQCQGLSKHYSTQCIFCLPHIGKPIKPRLWGLHSS